LLQASWSCSNATGALGGSLKHTTTPAQPTCTPAHTIRKRPLCHPELTRLVVDDNSDDLSGNLRGSHHARGGVVAKERGREDLGNDLHTRRRSVGQTDIFLKRSRTQYALHASNSLSLASRGCRWLSWARQLRGKTGHIRMPTAKTRTAPVGRPGTHGRRPSLC